MWISRIRLIAMPDLLGIKSLILLGRILQKHFDAKGSPFAAAQTHFWYVHQECMHGCQQVVTRHPREGLAADCVKHCSEQRANRFRHTLQHTMDWLFKKSLWKIAHVYILFLLVLKVCSWTCRNSNHYVHGLHYKISHVERTRGWPTGEPFPTHPFAKQTGKPVF